MAILAAVPVVEPIAVADIEALLAAIPPDCELHEPGKDLWKTAVELPSVDLAGNQPDNIGAAAWPVTAGPVGMGSLESGQDPGPVQKIVYQSVNGDQLAPTSSHLGRPSAAPIRIPDNANGEDLVRNPVNIAQWFNQSIACLRQGVWRGLVVCLFQSVVDPADQVAVGNVSNEQVETVSNLIEMAVSQAMGW